LSSFGSSEAETGDSITWEVMDNDSVIVSDVEITEVFTKMVELSIAFGILVGAGIYCGSL